MARHGIVGLVAVHIHHQPAPSRDLAQSKHRRRSIGHGALEMRDAADNVNAKVERALELGDRARRPPVAVLRKRNELQIEIGLHATLYLKQGLYCEQPRIAYI